MVRRMARSVGELPSQDLGRIRPRRDQIVEQMRLRRFAKRGFRSRVTDLVSLARIGPGQ